MSSNPTSRCPGCRSPRPSGNAVPNFEDACACWIYAGGAHHTGFSQAVTTEMLEDFAAMAGIEVVVIDANTQLRQFKQELVWNDAAYGLKSGWIA
jgi:L-arabinose isomerase